MKENSRSLYDEFRVTVSDTEFIFFIDNGFEQRNAYRSENHSHKFNEIIYCFKGSVEIAYEKETQKITAGEMVLIPEKTVHSLSADDDTYCMFLSFWNDDKWQTKKNIMVFKNFPAVNAFERILEYYYNNYTYKKELIAACLHELAAMLAEIYLSQDIDAKKTVTLENNNYRIYIIEQYFQSEYDKAPRITELADLLHLSVGQTQRIIAKLYSQTFRERILLLRMNKAKNLLTDTNKSVEEISVATGYKTVHNFYSAFRVYNGKTPKQYRKNARF